LWLNQLPRESAKRFIVGTFGGFVTLVGITLILAPSSISWWLTVTTNAGDSASKLIHFERWATHTTVTMVRHLSLHMDGTIPRWPMVTIPASTFILASLCFWLRRPRIEWARIMPPMLCLSLATSSYGWAYDQSVLILCNYLLFAHVSKFKDRIVATWFIISLISIQVVPILIIGLFDLPFYSLFLTPWALLALMGLLIRYENRLDGQRLSTEGER
jgi:hypothetical protein